MASATAVTIRRQDLDVDDVPEAVISDVKPIASYNWIEAHGPTIAVPGIPPRWSPPRVARKLPKDSGMIYIAQNAVRHPDYPLEPLFRAVVIADPEFDLRSVDVVTDRNNIRKLLAFINPSSSRNGGEVFTISVEVKKDTAILCRTETKIQEFIGPREFKGFGHEFEKAYTTCEIGDSTGHHRIVSYLFGGLRFVVRHEVDGYVQDDKAVPSSSSKGTGADSLSSLMGSLSLSAASSAPATTKPAGSKLAIRREGRAVPLESTLEIKTRTSNKPMKIREVAPQLWASQTPKLVRAYHTHGLFQVPQVEETAWAIRDWERDNQADLRRLAVLIKRLVGAVKECGGRAVVRYDNVADELRVTRVGEKGTLPQDLYRKVTQIGEKGMLPEDLYSRWDD